MSLSYVVGYRKVCRSCQRSIGEESKISAPVLAIDFQYTARSNLCYFDLVSINGNCKDTDYLYFRYLADCVRTVVIP